MRVTYLAAAIAAAGVAAWNAQAGWQLHASQFEDALGNYLASALIVAGAVWLARRSLSDPPASRPDDAIGGIAERRAVDTTPTSL